MLKLMQWEWKSDLEVVILVELYDQLMRTGGKSEAEFEETPSFLLQFA